MKRTIASENTFADRIAGIATRLILAFFVLATSTAHAAKVVAINPVSNVAGATSTHNGSTFIFTDDNTRYASTTTDGTDSTVTIKSPTYNTDVYFVKASGIGLDARTYRYAQIFYTLSDDFSGSTHQLRLKAADGESFVTFTDSTSIPTNAGSHSFVIDLCDGTDLNTTTSGNQYSGSLTMFRWDFWNNTGNAGKSFTLHKVVFATVQSGDTVLPSEYGFETPLITNSPAYSVINPSPSAWSFGANSGICRNGGARMQQSSVTIGDGKAAEGAQSAYLLDNGAFISTSVSNLTPRATYTLQFDAAGRETTFKAMEFEVLINGSALTFAGTNTITPVEGFWNVYTSEPFTASSAPFTLNFNGLYEAALGTGQSSYIDFVRFNYVDAGPPAGTVLIIK